MMASVIPECWECVTWCNSAVLVSPPVWLPSATALFHSQYTAATLIRVLTSTFTEEKISTPAKIPFKCAATVKVYASALVVLRMCVRSIRSLTSEHTVLHCTGKERCARRDTWWSTPGIKPRPAAVTNCMPIISHFHVPFIWRVRPNTLRLHKMLSPAPLLIY